MRSKIRKTIMAPPLHKTIQDPAHFAALVDEYIQACIAEDRSPFKIGFCVANGIGKDQMSRWQGKYVKGSAHDPQGLISRAIKKLEDASECSQVSRLDSASSTPNAMFLLKCNHGYVETSKTLNEHSGNVTVVVNSSIPGPLGNS